MSVAPEVRAQLQQIIETIRTHDRVRPTGGGSKPALSSLADGAVPVPTGGLSGVVEYQPDEYTFTALAGTPVQQVNELLARHGQHLPFDPPLVRAGATLGGTVAAGLSGPGRLRFGGVRDFLLGVQFVDGSGNVVRGGGRVVKNAAGFDFPKLMVGSLGRYGVLTELSFKVFPAPAAHLTVRLNYGSFEAARAALVRLGVSTFDLASLELWPDGTLLARFGGVPEALPARAERLQAFLGTAGEVLTGDAEAQLWDGLREFSGFTAPALVKVPLTPGRLARLEPLLDGFQRQYSAGGQLAWVGGQVTDLPQLSASLRRLDLTGLLLRGDSVPLIGSGGGNALLNRVAGALDPDGKFARVGL